MSGPCAKQRVIAEIVTPTGEHILGENLCATPQETCPREGMPTGVGYHLCREVCGQIGHAEVNAIAKAGPLTDGATLILYGHTYACDLCRSSADMAGIVEIRISGARI